jgi:ABC-type phosphate transport system permease subunit
MKAALNPRLLERAQGRGRLATDRTVHFASAAVAALIAACTLMPLAFGIVGARGVTASELAAALAPMAQSSLLGLFTFVLAVPLAVGCALATIAHPNSLAVRTALLSTRFLASVPGVVLSLCAAIVAHYTGNAAAAVGALGAVAAPRLLWDIRRAIYRVPTAERETALALGARPGAIFLHVVLRRARHELAAAVLRNAAVCFGASACLLLIPWQSGEPISVTVVHQSLSNLASAGTCSAVVLLTVGCAALQLAATTLATRRVP